MNKEKQQDRRLEEKKNKTKEKMRKMLKSVPNIEDLGFALDDESGSWQIFTVIFF